MNKSSQENIELDLNGDIGETNNMLEKMNLDANYQESAINVWMTLPVKIRNDPIFSPFRERRKDDQPKSKNNQLKENDVSPIILQNEKSSKEHLNHWTKYLKLIVLFIVWILSMVALATTKEKNLISKFLHIPESMNRNYILPRKPIYRQFTIQLNGTFFTRDLNRNEVSGSVNLLVQVTGIDSSIGENISYIRNISATWTVPVDTAALLDESSLTVRKKLHFPIEDHDWQYVENPNTKIQLKTWTNLNRSFEMQIIYDYSPVNMQLGTAYAAAALVFLYVLIIFEIVHRTFAAVLCSVMCLAILATFDDKPTMVEIVKWMDIETLLLLFSMMSIVAILTETGIFDYIAVVIYKVTRGKVWPLVHSLCIVTLVISSFLDNVTTILLMTPITIRLCNIIHLDPVPILMAIVVHANIGGTVTPIGDPPNIIITSNEYIARHGVTFITFTIHMGLGVILVVIQTAIHLRLKFRNLSSCHSTEPNDLIKELTDWKNTSESLQSDMDGAAPIKNLLLEKINRLSNDLNNSNESDPDEILIKLKQQYPIKNKTLLIKSGFVFIFIITLFLIQSMPALQRLSLGWSALLGVLLLLIIADRSDMDSLMLRIEWATLLFFAAMFIIMETFARLGLITWIGKQTEIIILSVGKESRLAMAIFVILWVSAIVSAFVDSIPVTAMMVKVVVGLAENESLGLPLQPLVWALAFGPCLGGNGTLYGASSNVVCAGIAAQYSYKISFMNFFKTVFPMMIGSVVVITGYLMFAHILFEWH